MIGSGDGRLGAKLAGIVLAGLVLAGLTLSACGSEASVTKAGGAEGPIVLRFGTNDFPGRAGADQIVEFGRHVAELTDGEVRIEGVWEAGRAGDARRWDQRVAQRVIDGDLDGGNIPARAWDLLDVATMKALHAPFVVTSEEAMHAVVSDGPLVENLLGGLEEAGVTGLALVPESIRYVFGFQDPPMTTAADFEGALVRSPASATTWALFETLGAVADDLPDMGPAIDDGTLDAIESSFDLVDNNPRANAIGNLPLFPKTNVLTVNDDVFARLSGEHRDALRAAAEATRDWAINTNPTAEDAAAEFCAGASVLHVSDAEVEVFHAKSAPVIDEMAADPVVAPVLDAIRTLVGALAPGGVVAACAPTETVPTTAPSALAVDGLEGTYRFELTVDDMRESGVPEDWIERNSFATSIMTITLADGILTADDYPGVVEGTYTVADSGSGSGSGSGSEVTFRLDDWGSHWVMTPDITDDGITWTFVDSLPPWGSDEDRVIDRAFWTTHPWVRIADAR